MSNHALEADRQSDPCPDDCPGCNSTGTVGECGSEEPVYYFCNSCGEEVASESDECCEDGEIEPSYDD